MSHRNLTVRLTGAKVSLRLDVRTLIVLVIVLGLLALAVGVTLAFGEIPFSLSVAWRAVFGHGSRFAQLIVHEFRLPRVLEGALIGGMLGLSGALFQRLTGNGLVSPDIIGINEGAAVAAVVTILFSTDQNILPLTAFAGGMAAATVGFMLSLRRGLSVYRLVLVGIAITAILGVAMNFLTTYAQNTQNANLVEARDWADGSLVYSNFSQVKLLAVAFAVLAPATLMLGRALDLLSLGEDGAQALSLRVGWTRAAVVMVGTLLAATAVAMVGPIGFVAFISPHIAKRIAKNSASGSLLLSGAVGALLLVAADYVAQRIIEPNELPVGIVTVALGAPYFLLLLYRGGRRGNVV